MKVKNLNNSSKKTKQLIKENFALLLKEKKKLKNITVTELVKRANITRSTFYTHYDSIYDVADDFQEEALDLLDISTRKFQFLEDIDYYFDYVFEFLKENEYIYTLILSSNEPLLFTNRLTKIMNKKLYNILENYNISDLELNITFFLNGCIILIIKHFRRELSNSLDEINEYCKKLFKRLFFLK